MSKRDFFDWMEQQSGKYIGPNEQLMDFEKNFGQLPLSKKCLLEVKKSKLFLQAA